MNILKKIALAVLAVLLLLAIVYACGPRVKYDDLQLAKQTNLDFSIHQLDSLITAKEAKIPQLKPDNESRIIWAEGNKQKTKYAIVYLHGFSASQEEGDPLHVDFAKRYGANLYLPRLYDHGRLDSNTFKNLQPQALYDSAEEALAIGKMLGDSIILMSCSTGGSLSVLLAQHHPEIHSFIMYSPNIAIADPAAALTTMPWGKQIMDLVMGGTYNRIKYTPDAQKYWTPTYHTDGILALQTLINMMTEERFKKISQPLFVGAYYKDEDHQDDVVSVSAMRTFYDQVSTPASVKSYKEFPKAEKHVISSYIFSKDIDGVQQATYEFADQVLRLPKAVVIDTLTRLDQ